MNLPVISRPQDWKYLARGNSNAVYRYQGPTKRLQNKVLRLRLHKPPELYISTLELVHYMKANCEKYFSKNFIETDLVKVNFDFVSNLETHDFKLMLCEINALLLDDILCGNYKCYNLSKNCKLHVDQTSESEPRSINSIIIELKPKWLYSNKTNYCRNCAVCRLRKVGRHFCPIDFLSGTTCERGIDDLLSKVPEEISYATQEYSYFKLRKLLREYLRTPDNVFQNLKALQALKNNHELLSSLKSSDDVSDALLFTMTMRDVGVFIKFTKASSMIPNCGLPCPFDTVIFDDHDKYTVETYVYDFDLKLRTKLEHWKKMETLLQEYYDSYDETWRLCTGTDCKL